MNAVRSAWPTFAVAMLVATAWHPADAQVPTVGGIVFSQLDWLRPDGLLAQANSSWGQMEYAYLPQSTTTFLNVTATNAAGGPEAWVIQNLPLFGVDNGSFAARRESVYLNLQELGLSAGQDLAGLRYTFSVDAAVRATALTGTSLSSPVATLVRRASDLPGEAPDPGPFTDPGRPQGVHLTLPPVKLNNTRDIRSVQEADSFCFTGSVARSLDWLNREHGLGSTRSAQQIYEDLALLGTSAPVPGATAPYRDDWIGIKNQYARRFSSGHIVTKVWDSGDQVDAVPGVAEEGGDFATWLKREYMHGEDIELAYFYPGNAHIITIVDAYVDANGDLLVDYRDDEAQADSTKGDAAIKKGAKIYKDGTGKYHFGSDNNTIYFAVSESFIPEPASLMLLAAAALGWCVCRRVSRSQPPSTSAIGRAPARV